MRVANRRVLFIDTETGKEYIWDGGTTLKIKDKSGNTTYEKLPTKNKLFAAASKKLNEDLESFGNFVIILKEKGNLNADNLEDLAD